LIIKSNYHEADVMSSNPIVFIKRKKIKQFGWSCLQVSLGCHSLSFVVRL